MSINEREKYVNAKNLGKTIQKQEILERQKS